jgi:hypothetical protein
MRNGDLKLQINGSRIPIIKEEFEVFEINSLREWLT